MPRAPGTAGSLQGLALGYTLHHACGLHLGMNINNIIVTGLVLSALIGGAWFSIHVSAAHHRKHDDQRIVIDEIVSQALAVVFLPTTLFYYGFGFLLFRFFDITKPGPVGWADRHLSGAWGILVDDLFAGLFTSVILITASVAFG